MKPFPYSIHPKNEDEKWMLYALKEAWIAFQNDEVPVGAVLVQDGAIIAKGNNQVEMLQDATAHAEMLCITSASGLVGNWRLSNTTLYSTLEPCSMCGGAILLSRIPKVVWGAKDLRHGANGSWTDLFSLTHPMHKTTIMGGILEEYSAKLLKDFFAHQRILKETQNEIE